MTWIAEAMRALNRFQETFFLLRPLQKMTQPDDAEGQRPKSREPQLCVPYNKEKEGQTSKWLHIYAVTTPLEKLFIAGGIQFRSRMQYSVQRGTRVRSGVL